MDVSHVFICHLVNERKSTSDNRPGYFLGLSFNGVSSAADWHVLGCTCDVALA